MPDQVKLPLLRYAGKLLYRSNSLTRDKDCCCPCPAETVVTDWEASQSTPPGPNNDDWNDFIALLLQDEIDNPHLYYGWSTRAALAYYLPPASSPGVYPNGCAYVTMVHQSCDATNEEAYFSRIDELDQQFFGNQRRGGEVKIIPRTNPPTCASLREEIEPYFHILQCTCAEPLSPPGKEWLLNRYLKNCCGPDKICGNTPDRPYDDCGAFD